MANKNEQVERKGQVIADTPHKKPAIPQPKPTKPMIADRPAPKPKSVPNPNTNTKPKPRQILND